MFDRAYFDRFYRGRGRVKSPTELRRQVAMVVSAAEWVLGRPIRDVLDIGCGEGHWRAPLRSIRPRVRYVGLDPSEYAVRRFGRRRGIRFGGFSDLTAVSEETPFDLVVCVGVAQFLTDAELAKGLPLIAAKTSGMLHFEAFTKRDGIVGDRRGRWRSAGAYRRMISAAGLVACGMHNYVTRDIAADRLSELEHL